MKPLLSPRTIAAIRTLARQAMQDTCTLTRGGTRTMDGGEVTLGAPTTLGPYPCRLVSGNGQQIQTSDLVKMRGSYTLHLPIGTNVHRDDTVTLAERTFRIVYIAPISAFDADLAIGLEDS